MTSHLLLVTSQFMPFLRLSILVLDPPWALNILYRSQFLLCFLSSQFGDRYRFANFTGIKLKIACTESDLNNVNAYASCY